MIHFPNKIALSHLIPPVQSTHNPVEHLLNQLTNLTLQSKKDSFFAGDRNLPKPKKSDSRRPSPSSFTRLLARLPRLKSSSSPEDRIREGIKELFLKDEKSSSIKDEIAGNFILAAENISELNKALEWIREALVKVMKSNKLDSDEEGYIEKKVANFFKSKGLDRNWQETIDNFQGN